MTEDQFDMIMRQLDNLKQETEERHAENKKTVEDIKRDNEIILDWINGAQLGVKLIVGSGHALTWIAKIAVAALSLFGLYSAVKNGKFPSISLGE